MARYGSHLSRRHFLQGSLALAGLGLVAACGLPPLPGQQAAEVPRIGVLGDTPATSRWDAFRDGLREHGYVDGQNLTIEYRWAAGDYGRLPALLAELVGLEVACILTGGTTESTAAKQATTTIPIVAVLQNFDAIETGLVANIAHPEGNVTGLAGASGRLLQQKLPDLLKEAIPALGRVGVLAHAQQSGVQGVLEGVKEAAARLGLQLEIAMVQGPAGIEPAFAAFSAAGARALAIINTSAFNNVRARLAELALVHRLPAITTDLEFPGAGGLMAYSVNRNALFHRAASYVDRLLDGATPAELPMERPTQFDFAINLQTAQALQLTIPESVLAQATEIIQ